MIVVGFRKKMLLFAAVLVCCVNFALSEGITSGPGLKRVYYTGDTVEFQWSVTGNISSYTVRNLYRGVEDKFIAPYAYYIVDKQSGVVILFIKSVQLSDAGNYSLSVTIGTTKYTDSSAKLFVYGPLSMSVNQTSGGSGQQPATEGDAVELTCTAISTSAPWWFRTQIYYQWYVALIGTFVNVSSGPATLYEYSDPVPGYFIKNDGRTLVIASAQYRDTQGIFCYGQEQWSAYPSKSPWLYLPLNYRPLATTISPASRKFTAIVGDRISFQFYYQASSAVSSATNWSFVDTAGYAQDLPGGSYSSHSDYAYHLSFTLTSEAYYGNYSITISNSIGATTETFQVLGLGPPDAPSSVRADFVSHYLIAIAWNCMWFNGRQQTIFLQLRTANNDSILDSQNTTLSSECYNYTYSNRFQNGIQPESDYEVRVWSTNTLGSSDVVKLPVRTPKVFKFFVSPKTISINRNQAIVNYNATDGKIAKLEILYCVELTGVCVWSSHFNLNSTAGQLEFDLKQPGDAYVFDFTVYGAYPRLSGALYSLTAVKDVRVSRNTTEAVEPDDKKPDDEKPDDKKPDDTKPDDEKPDDKKPDDKKPDDKKPDDEQTNPLFIAVIVLAVLLGVAVLALIGCLLAFLISKRRQSTQPKLPNNSQQPQENRYS